MSDIEHDEKLPFALAYSTGDEPLARFRNSWDAERFQQHFMSEGVIIDTTPQPKIPADAEFIHWRDLDDQPYYARRVGHPSTKVWETDENDRLDENYILDLIGTADVEVLKRAT